MLAEKSMEEPHLTDAQDEALVEQNDTPEEATPESQQAQLSRRQFLALAAILAGSTALVLGRHSFDRAPGDIPSTIEPAIPQGFRRFVIMTTRLAPDGSTRPPEAYGAQCPDGACVLLWQNKPDFEFHDHVADIMDSYVSDGDYRLKWLD